MNPETAAFISGGFSLASASIAAILVYFNGKKKNKIEEGTSLSEAESRFRREIMEELRLVKRELDTCKKDLMEAQAKHAACEQRANDFEQRIKEMEKELNILKCAYE